MKGWKLLIRVALGLLKLYEKSIYLEPVDNLPIYICNLIERDASPLDKLFEYSLPLKVTNRLLLSLENIYELHISQDFKIPHLNILLFRNQKLNNAFDWKILPQAPDFEGLNSTLERLNSHTM